MGGKTNMEGDRATQHEHGQFNLQSQLKKTTSTSSDKLLTEMDE